MFKSEVFEKKTEESIGIPFFVVKFTASFVSSIDACLDLANKICEIEDIRDRNGDLAKLTCFEDTKTGLIRSSLNSNKYRAKITAMDSLHT